MLRVARIPRLPVALNLIRSVGVMYSEVLTGFSKSKFDSKVT